MIKVSIQAKSGRLVTHTVITLLASAIDLMESLTSHHGTNGKNDSNQQYRAD